MVLLKLGNFKDFKLNLFKRIQNQKLVVEHPRKLTLFAFPNMVDRMRERLSTEKLMDRIEKMQISLEKAAAK